MIITTLPNNPISQNALKRHSKAILGTMLFKWHYSTLTIKSCLSVHFLESIETPLILHYSDFDPTYLASCLFFPKCLESPQNILRHDMPKMRRRFDSFEKYDVIILVIEIQLSPK